MQIESLDNIWELLQLDKFTAPSLPLRELCVELLFVETATLLAVTQMGHPVCHNKV